MIKHIVDAATRNNVGLCICGEIAGDIKYTIMLLGLGIRELSMNAVLIPAVKNIIRNISYAEIQKLIAPLLNMKSSTEIEAELNKLNTKLGLL